MLVRPSVMLSGIPMIRGGGPVPEYAAKAAPAYGVQAAGVTTITRARRPSTLLIRAAGITVITKRIQA